MTIGKLDLPHIVVYNGALFDYYRPRADIYTDVFMMDVEEDSNVQIGFDVINWKWGREARVGFVMDIAGTYYWAPHWNQAVNLPERQFDTGLFVNIQLTVPAPTGAYGIPVTFYAALLHPTQDILLNGAAWDMLTVNY